MRRHWSPCRVCGVEHTNPMSSSICSACGADERDTRERDERMAMQAYEASAFGRFMSLPEEERWRMIFERLHAMEDAA